MANVHKLINCTKHFVADVNVDLPDKKSILIYVMCCFQALSQARFANSGSTNMDNMTQNSGTPLIVTSTARLTMGSQQVGNDRENCSLILG